MIGMKLLQNMFHLLRGFGQELPPPSPGCVHASDAARFKLSVSDQSATGLTATDASLWEIKATDSAC